MHADRPVSLYLVVPPSDISRTKPLVRLILNQIARRLTETLDAANDNAPSRQLLLMLDEFPALGRLDFFESSLAFLAGYGVRAFLVAQSLHQIDKAYGHNHAILDNCHVRVAFAPNDERTAKRLSDALGTATELRAQTNLSGKRLSAWLSHTSVSEQETPRPLLTPGEVLQLPADDALVLVSGVPPIRAAQAQVLRRSQFYRAPPAGARAAADALPPICRRARPDDWSGQHARHRCAPRQALVGAGDCQARSEDETRPRARDIPRRKKDKAERPLSDLPLFAELTSEPAQDERRCRRPIHDGDRVIQFPGLRL